MLMEIHVAKREKLSSGRIVQAAIKMIDERGEKGFSMRKLAAELGVDPMAIYHHHANRDAVIQEVMQTMMDSCDVPEPTGDWQKDLTHLCSGLRDLAQRHPGAFRIYETYENWVPAELRLHEAMHAILRQAGFSKQKTVQAARLLLTYTEAFAVDEISGWLDPEDHADLTEQLEQGPYKTMLGLVDEMIRPDANADFEFGLHVLLHGLTAERSDA